jgi:hypothetical protein
MFHPLAIRAVNSGTIEVFAASVRPGGAERAVNAVSIGIESASSRGTSARKIAASSLIRLDGCLSFRFLVEIVPGPIIVMCTQSVWTAGAWSPQIIAAVVTAVVNIMAVVVGMVVASQVVRCMVKSAQLIIGFLQCRRGN